MKITTIEMVKTTTDLSEFLENEAARLNLELDNSMTFGDQADFYEEKSEKVSDDEANSMIEMAETLREAENKWFEMEEA